LRRGGSHVEEAQKQIVNVVKIQIHARAQGAHGLKVRSAYVDAAINNAYHNPTIATQEIIDELINLAHEMREAAHRGENLGLSDDELAFYDALAMNESAVEVMGVDELKVIATELLMKVRQSVTIDWTIREASRAKMRVMVRRILRQHGYPPDLQESATRLVLEQADVLCAEWAA
jgi:type I restriction enzyme R subunit